MHSQTGVGGGKGGGAHTLFAAHNSSGSLLSFGASTVYTCSTFSVLSKTMVFLSATVVQGGCGKCLSPGKFTTFTQMQSRKCCNNCFDYNKCT